MKRILVVLLLFSAVAVRADDRSEAILARMAGLFGGYGNYRVDFTADMPGEFEQLKGSYIVSGKKYYLEVNDNQVFFDGTDRYTYSESNSEVVVEKPDPSDRSLLSDPTSVFTFYGEDFTHSVTGTSGSGSQASDIVTLRPKSPGGEVENIVLRVSRTTGLPVSIAYRLSGYSRDISLAVDKITPLGSVDDATFRFDPLRYPDVELIDFR